MKVKRNELDVSNYSAPNGKILIKPFSHMKRTVEVTDFELKPTEDGEDPTKSEGEPEYVPVTKKERAPFECQLAEVISSGSPNYKVGDVVVYSIKFVKAFDLFKETFLASDYDLYGKYNLEV